MSVRVGEENVRGFVGGLLHFRICGVGASMCPLRSRVWGQPCSASSSFWGFKEGHWRRWTVKAGWQTEGRPLSFIPPPLPCGRVASGSGVAAAGRRGCRCTLTRLSVFFLLGSLLLSGFERTRLRRLPLLKIRGNLLLQLFLHAARPPHVGESSLSQCRPMKCNYLSIYFW